MRGLAQAGIARRTAVLGLLGLAAGTGWSATLPAVLSQPALLTPKALGAATLAVTRAGPRLVAVGERGTVLLSDDHGVSWKQAAVPVQATLTCVRFVDEKTGWAAGHLGVVLRSADGGRSWQPVDTGLQVGLTSAAVDNDGRIIIASQAGHVLASRDDGATCNAVQIERPIPAAAVISAAKDSIIVAGPRGVHSQSLK